MIQVIPLYRLGTQAPQPSSFRSYYRGLSVAYPYVVEPAGAIGDTTFQIGPVKVQSDRPSIEKGLAVAGIVLGTGLVLKAIFG